MRQIIGFEIVWHPIRRSGLIRLKDSEGRIYKFESKSIDEIANYFKFFGSGNNLWIDNGGIVLRSDNKASLDGTEVPFPF